jgi:hypothetical protein
MMEDTQIETRAQAMTIRVAKAHYADSDEPLFLSAVGQALRAENLWPIPDEKRSLKKWLKSLEPDLFLLEDEDSPARVAIATAEKAGIVHERIYGLRDVILLSRTARPVLLAFCAKGNEDGPVYLTSQPPFRYTLTLPDEPGDYLTIAPNYRLPGLHLRAIQRMPTADVANLARSLRSWAEATKVDINALSKDAAPVSSEAAPLPPGTMNALERLIQAQRPELRHQFHIPGDIAALLSRHR